MLTFQEETGAFLWRNNLNFFMLLCCVHLGCNCSCDESRLVGLLCIIRVLVEPLIYPGGLFVLSCLQQEIPRQWGKSFIQLAQAWCIAHELILCSQYALALFLIFAALLKSVKKTPK